MVVTYDDCQYWYHPGNLAVGRALANRTRYANRLSGLDCLGTICGGFFCLAFYPIIGLIVGFETNGLVGLSVWLGLTLLTLGVIAGTYKYNRWRLDRTLETLTRMTQAGELVNTFSGVFDHLHRTLVSYNRPLSQLLTSDDAAVLTMLALYMKRYHQIDAPQSNEWREQWAKTFAAQVDDHLGKREAVAFP